jgi:hypothetical protein
MLIQSHCTKRVLQVNCLARDHLDPRVLYVSSWFVTLGDIIMRCGSHTTALEPVHRAVHFQCCVLSGTFSAFHRISPWFFLPVQMTEICVMGCVRTWVLLQPPFRTLKRSQLLIEIGDSDQHLLVGSKILRQTDNFTSWHVDRVAGSRSAPPPEFLIPSLI